MLSATPLWKETYPGASAAYMVLGNVCNPEQSDALEPAKRQLEAALKLRFPVKEDLTHHEAIAAYSNYYKRHKKTYHVLHQLESVIFKGKSIPRVAGLVEAMFMAELKNGLLTAGHDCAALQTPLMLDVASGDENYLLINGREQVAKQGDMKISDAMGVISSVIHGPDFRNRIVPETQRAIFTVYAPAGIPRQSVADHLTDIYAYVKLLAPAAEIERQDVIG
jgi:DNA/RNA-binding domain of Phe-tRNA-synthetase-like protein